MIATPAVRNIIRENKSQTLYNVILTGQSSSMQTMDSCVKSLYQQGIITYDVAVTRMKYPQELRSSSGNGAVDPSAVGTL